MSRTKASAKKPSAVTARAKRATVRGTPREMPAGRPPSSFSPGPPRRARPGPPSALDAGLALLGAAGKAADAARDERRRLPPTVARALSAHIGQAERAHEREMRELEALAAVVKNAHVEAVRAAARGRIGVSVDELESAFIAGGVPCGVLDVTRAVCTLLARGELERVGDAVSLARRPHGAIYRLVEVAR
jgi:hypothetical protein